jgi:branched-chain amino acid transport system permease protein
MQILLQLVFSGIALGMIYAVIAFGYQLTFATSDTLNFGQGEALTLGALVGLTLVDGAGLNYWLALPVICLFGALQGGVVERIAVRPAIRIKSEFGWIMSTIALGIIFKNVAENLWGRDDLKFPSPLPEAPLKVLGANVLPMELLIVAGALAMMLAIELFSRRTIYGGLTSGMGVVVGGLLLGIAETATGYYLSTGYKDVPGLVLLLVVLAVKPAGLFGRGAIKKV